MKGKITFKGGTGSGNFGHSGRPGHVGGSGGGTGGRVVSNRQQTVDKAASYVKWKAEAVAGRTTLIHGGSDPGSGQGPKFFTTDPEMAYDYGSGKDIYAFSFDKARILTSGTSAWNRLFGSRYDEYGPDLYTDPPKSLLNALKNAGFAGYASYSGQYVRIDDMKLAKSRFYRKVV